METKRCAESAGTASTKPLCASRAHWRLDSVCLTSKARILTAWAQAFDYRGKVSCSNSGATGDRRAGVVLQRAVARYEADDPFVIIGWQQR